MGLDLDIRSRCFVKAMAYWSAKETASQHCSYVDYHLRYQIGVAPYWQVARESREDRNQSGVKLDAYHWGKPPQPVVVGFAYGTRLEGGLEEDCCSYRVAGTLLDGEALYSEVQARNSGKQTRFFDQEKVWTLESRYLNTAHHQIVGGLHDCCLHRVLLELLQWRWLLPQRYQCGDFDGE